MKISKFVYLLNAMESASRAERPHEHDYSGKRLAVLALHYRDEVLGLSQGVVCARAGFSDKTLYKIENATQTNYASAILRGLDNGLGWRSGSARAVLTGESEDVVKDPDKDPPAIVTRQVGDDAVAELSGPPDAEIDAMTPEELKSALRAALGRNRPTR